MARPYKRKANLKRFFSPHEWNQFLSVISNDKHKFFFNVLLHTGARHNEIKDLKVTNINFPRERLTLNMGKTGSTGKTTSREIQTSTWLNNTISTYVRANNIGKLDTLGMPSVQYIDRMIKSYCKAAGIADYEDFSAHNLRKTLENWLIGLNVNVLSVQAHMGHTINVAAAHYISTNLLDAEEKMLIKLIIGNLLQK